MFFFMEEISVRPFWWLSDLGGNCKCIYSLKNLTRFNCNSWISKGPWYINMHHVTITSRHRFLLRGENHIKKVIVMQWLNWMVGWNLVHCTAMWCNVTRGFTKWDLCYPKSLFKSKMKHSLYISASCAVDFEHYDPLDSVVHHILYCWHWNCNIDRSMFYKETFVILHQYLLCMWLKWLYLS